MIDSLWEFLRSGTNPKEESETTTEALNIDESKATDRDDEILIDLEDCSENVNNENVGEYSLNSNKSASKFAKDFLKILHETVNFKYVKTEDNSDLINVENSDVVPDIEFCAALQNQEQNEDLKRENSKIFENKLLNIFDFLIDIAKAPKSDVLSRVRRKSSCFWSEKSPSEMDSREETMEMSIKEEESELPMTSDDNMETYIEFLSNPGCSPKIELQNKTESIKSPNVKIQRKSFRKKSADGEEKMSLLEYIFSSGGERKKSDASTTKISKNKRVSLEESIASSTSKTKDQLADSDNRGSIVDLVLSSENRVCSILKSFSQDSSEIGFIDESPELLKSKENLVDFILKCMDNFESVNESMSRKNSRRKEDSDSKNNMLVESKIAIAKPEDFDLSPEMETARGIECVRLTRIFKDMGTSCDIPDSAGTSSLNSRLSPGEDDEFGSWIRPDQLAELRKCAEIIFKEVNRDLLKIAGASVDLCEKSTTYDTKVDEHSIKACDDCELAKSIPKIEKVSVALETSFDYDPTQDDFDSPNENVHTIVQVENVHNYFYRVELEMIKESFEVDDGDSP